MFGSRRWNLYVLRELMTPTLLGLLLYTFVLLMNHFFLVAEKALARAQTFTWDRAARLTLGHLEAMADNCLGGRGAQGSLPQ